MENTITSIKHQWNNLKIENPKLRIRDAAKELGLSEAELVNAGVGEHNTLLNIDFKELLKETNTLGYVMALTRNDFCVHERKGVYTKVGFNAHVGLVVTPDIDLRLFMTHWNFGFAVNENDRLSFQFFDADGSAVHKIYLTDKSDAKAYERMVAKYRADDQDQQLNIQPTPAKEVEKPDHEVAVNAFQEAWIALQDTHDFHGLLKDYGLTRTQALRLAPDGYALQISLSSLKQVLTNASETSTPIMVFTGSAGCIQIHTGEIKKLVQTGPWFNVLDPEFNMHLREDGIDSIWLVKKPTADGLVHSIEVYDKEGNTIVQFFGKRKPGIPESEAWRALLNDVNNN
ncbi:hemin-degrading factor [Mucilaginibacter aquaedulcis]|uniref:hemin-degrading factor n=1 Tax=Mucilaginibacter aquaedulcis TaxID=1187081 RepID=UPI0025B42AC6|nr:ChuX/HutX family heme-like substrate-binding protein [Mucilaginibacter aquaedulcis]MDN3547783.1 ChuX/HutX family heme-like substrate-binding protein [Mucilaginibacter aquaedulcis]